MIELNDWMKSKVSTPAYGASSMIRVDLRVFNAVVEALLECVNSLDESM